MRALLDVNLLIALVDPLHINHDQAQRYFEALENGWASCPITQNGMVRIISQPRYPNSVLPREAGQILASLCAHPDHEFWADSLSLADDMIFDRESFSSADRLTDIYLLGLAVANGGCLATLDRKLNGLGVKQAEGKLIKIE